MKGVEEVQPLHNLRVKARNISNLNKPVIPTGNNTDLFIRVGKGKIIDTSCMSLNLHIRLSQGPYSFRRRKKAVEFRKGYKIHIPQGGF